jgi:hypothetical protein
MNELTNIALITLSILATIGVIASVTFGLMLFYQWREKNIFNDYLRIRREHEKLAGSMQDYLHESGNATPEAYWILRELGYLIKYRRIKTPDEIKEALEDSHDTWNE